MYLTNIRLALFAHSKISTNLVICFQILFCCVKIFIFQILVCKTILCSEN